MTQNPPHHHCILLFSIKPLKSTWCHFGRGACWVLVHSMPCTPQSLSVNTERPTINYERKEATLRFNNCCQHVAWTELVHGLRIRCHCISDSTRHSGYVVWTMLCLSCFSFFSSIRPPCSVIHANTDGHFGSASWSSYRIMIPASVGIRPQLHPFPFPLLTPSFQPANHALAAFKWQ